MTQAGAAAAGRPDPISQARFAWLMGARIALSATVLSVSLFIEGIGRATSQAAHDGLYATVGLAFLITAVYGLWLPRMRRADRFGAVQLVTDLALVTALVHFSGGHESIFSFLYVPVVAYGAIFFDRRGAAAAALTAAAHGAMLLATHLGLVRGFAPPAPAELLLARWSVLSGAVLLVAFLASVLRRELNRADEALDASASDLRRLRNLHERIVASLTSGLLTTTGGGRITSFNREAAAISGVDEADAIGRDIEDVLPGARELVMMSEDPGGPGGHRRRMRLSNRRGEVLHVGLAGSVLRDAEGRPSGFVVIFQDVTDVVRMEQELRRKERLAAAGQLSADLAHEVRNPLAAISGSIQMLRARAGGDDSGCEEQRLMDIVLRETDRLNGLIDDFLAYARPAPARRERVPLAAVVDDVLKMFESVRPAGIEVALELEPGLLVLADPGQVRQLVWNLVLNAAQAMPDGGRLELGARAASQDQPGARRDVPVEGGPGVVELRIADTGSGIAPEMMDRIFDPFFTTKRGGTGLGLATVHRIVEGNGGMLRVESAPGTGTIFHVVLAGAKDAA